MIEARKLKDKAAEAFAKGKFSKAAELYEQYCASDPKDLQARLRMGDAFARSGNRGRAIQAYHAAAESFARDGFLPRAIAASKLILELDPSHKGIQQMLADLYARRGSSGPGEKKRVEGGPVIVAYAGRPAPSPTNRADAIELPPDDTPLELQTSSGAPAVRTEPPAGAIALGPVEAMPPAPPPAPPSEPASFGLSSEGRGTVNLSSELPPQLALGMEAPAAAAPPAPADEADDDGGVEIDLDDAEATAAPPAASAAPEPPPAEPPAMAAAPELAPAQPPPAAAPAPAPVAAPPAVSSAPPGLRLKRPAAPAPVAAPPSNPPAVAQPVPAAPAAVDPASASRFEGIEPAPAPIASIQVMSFSDLELQGDSLLHAVERAAMESAAAADELQIEEGTSSGEAEEVVFTTEELAETPQANALPKIPLFSDLPPDAFIELFERCPLRRVAKGAAIIKQGSTGKSFFVICEGSVRVVREDAGKRKELAVLTEGAFFGEMALLSEAPRAATVEAASDETQLLEITGPVLGELSHRYPSVAQALKKFCRQRMLANVMNTSALFRPFNKNDRKQLVERFRARDVHKDDVIIREGERTDGLYVLLSGEVEVKKGIQALAKLKEGDIFGEMSLLQKTPATATVAATKRTSLLRLPREAFDELILSHPQILVLVSELTEDRKRQTEAVLSGAAVQGDEGLMLV